MVKLLMSWDIRPGHEADYFDFMVREFAPGIMQLGLQPTEAWYTVFGSGPQMLAGGVAEDVKTISRILSSHEWDDLKQKLLAYVINFQYKIVPATGRFQLP